MADLFYPELRRLAAARMNAERPAHTWQPTALVHELYLELVKVKAFGSGGGSAEEERTAFLKLAGHIMKRKLAHHARPLHRGAQHIVADEGLLPGVAGDQDLQDVEDALSRLERIDPRLRTVVEMKVFEGMTTEEAARALGCSTGTVSGCWTWARTWLREEWADNRRV